MSTNWEYLDENGVDALAREHLAGELLEMGLVTAPLVIEEQVGKARIDGRDPVAYQRIAAAYQFLYDPQDPSGLETALFGRYEKLYQDILDELITRTTQLTALSEHAPRRGPTEWQEGTIMIVWRWIDGWHWRLQGIGSDGKDFETDERGPVDRRSDAETNAREAYYQRS